jgi:hypothetical protein
MGRQPALRLFSNYRCAPIDSAQTLSLMCRAPVLEPTHSGQIAGTRFHAVARPSNYRQIRTLPQLALGAAAATRVRLIVWCRDCRHQIEYDPAAMALRYGAGLSVPDWHQRLVCGQCGNGQIDFVVTGAKP